MRKPPQDSWGGFFMGKSEFCFYLLVVKKIMFFVYLFVN